MYWEREQEITLLWTVLEVFDSGTPDDRGAADGILCGLIDMGLVDMDHGPAAYMAWTTEWNGYGVTRDFVAEHYGDDD